jgi:hypothetical protein
MHARVADPHPRSTFHTVSEGKFCEVRNIDNIEEEDRGNERENKGEYTLTPARF